MNHEQYSKPFQAIGLKTGSVTQKQVLHSSSSKVTPSAVKSSLIRGVASLEGTIEK